MKSKSSVIPTSEQPKFKSASLQTFLFVQDLQERFTISSLLLPWLWGPPWGSLFLTDWHSIYSLVCTWNIVPIWLWLRFFVLAEFIDSALMFQEELDPSQWPSPMAATVSASPLELRCNYSSSVQTNLFWYVQYPNQGFQFFLKSTSKDSLVSDIINCFEVEFNRSENSFHWRKNISSLKDSALALLCSEDTVPGTSSELNTNLLRSGSLKDSGLKQCYF